MLEPNPQTGPLRRCGRLQEASRLLEWASAMQEQFPLYRTRQFPFFLIVILILNLNRFLSAAICLLLRPVRDATSNCMLKYLLPFVLLLATFPGEAADSQWQLVWSDEFDGPSLDLSK